MADDQTNPNLPGQDRTPLDASPNSGRSIQPVFGGDDEFDPANRSRASALRISFVALQIVMVVLVAMYFLSGWQQVPEQYRGLRLFFGRLQDSEPLEAGGYFVWPYPIGQFITVRNSQQSVTLADEFWPQLSAAQKGRPFSTLSPAEKISLVPGRDGSVITADHNLAHTSWNVQYRIVDARQNQLTVPDPSEAMNAMLVRRAVERAVVLSSAETTLDEIIQSRDRLSSKVKAYTQEFLDRIECGIEVTTATYDAYPPIPAQASYESVNNAHVKAAQQKVDAERMASETLNAMAGPAYQRLRVLIAEYEQILAEAKGDPAPTSAAQAKRQEIDDLLVSDAVGGKVATIIGTAKSERGELVASFRSDLARFNAWIDRYEADPTLTTTLLWTEMMINISQSNLEWFSVAPGTNIIEILWNADPARERRMKQQQYVKDIQSNN